MRKKAEAWKEYQDAAMVDMVLETLPKVIKHSLKVKLNELYRTTTTYRGHYKATHLLIWD